MEELRIVLPEFVSEQDLEAACKETNCVISLVSKFDGSLVYKIITADAFNFYNLGLCIGNLSLKRQFKLRLENR